MSSINARNEKIGNYRIVHQIGKGGFGEVYLGEHIYLKTPAAIKVLRSRISDDDFAQFLNEARTIARLDHPHIIRLLEFGIEDQIPYLIMAYAPNGTLRQRYPRGSVVPLAQIVPYVKQVANALQYAHDLNLIHRDIKPENILLGRNHEALLSDFGLAVISQSSFIEQGHYMVGTIAYMAPEQFDGKTNRASDQYALGTIVYELLSGSPPFHGTESEMAAQHLQATPPSLREKLPTLPAAVEQVILKTLAKDPIDRYPQIQQFAQALEQAAQVPRAVGQAGVPQNYLKGTSLIDSQQLAKELPEVAGGALPLPHLLSDGHISPAQHPQAVQDQQMAGHANNAAVHGVAVKPEDAQADRRPEIGAIPIPLPEQNGPNTPQYPIPKEPHEFFNANTSPDAGYARPSFLGRCLSRRALVRAGSCLGIAAVGGGSTWCVIKWISPAQKTTGTSKDSNTNARATGGSGTSTNAQGNKQSSSATNAKGPTSTATTPANGQTPTQSTGSGSGNGNNNGNGNGTPPPPQVTPVVVRVIPPNVLNVSVLTGSAITVTTSKSSIPVTLYAAYSNGNTQNVGTQTTDSTGKTTFQWQPQAGLLGSASLQAIAMDTNGKQVPSNSVQVTVVA